MTWAVLIYVVQGVVALGVVTTGILLSAMYLIEGETDEFDERIGPPRPIGVVVFGLLGVVLWLPCLPVFFINY